MIRFILFLSLLYLCLIVSPATAQEQELANAKPISFMDWLQEQKQVTFELYSDWDKLKKERTRYRYQPASIDVQDGDKHIQQELLVKPRGKYRCRTCEIPPIKLKFNKDTLLDAGFRKWNEFKIVMPCSLDKTGEQLLYKEFLVYRLYNLLTPHSLRVKMVNLQLKHNPPQNQVIATPAFVIEDEAESARLNKARILDTMGLMGIDFNPKAYLRFQVFQFMIGNTDWIPASGHNITFFQRKSGHIIPVPYDFDFSGMVSASYARPNSAVPIPDVQTRYFMGNEIAKEELEQVFAVFREKKAEMLNLVKDFEPLHPRERKKMSAYLESFFKIIDDSRKVRQYFLDKPPFDPIY